MRSQLVPQRQRQTYITDGRLIVA